MGWREFYNSHKSEIISFDIKDIMLIAHTVHTRECFPYVREIIPFCIFYFVEPVLQCFFTRRMLGIIIYQCLSFDYPHIALYATNQRFLTAKLRKSERKKQKIAKKMSIRAFFRTYVRHFVFHCLLPGVPILTF